MWKAEANHWYTRIIYSVFKNLFVIIYLLHDKKFMIKSDILKYSQIFYAIDGNSYINDTKTQMNLSNMKGK